MEMHRSIRRPRFAPLLLLLSVVAATPGIAAGAEMDTEALAKAAQNPVADMISFPFQDNIGFGYGPDRQVQNVLNIQPVIPIHVTEEWNVVTRSILPVVAAPGAAGLGNLNVTAFLSPRRPGEIIWGLGPIASFPTATSPLLGSQSSWGLGPSGVVLAMPGHWVIGVLVNQVWAVAGASTSQMLIQYFVNYNFAGGWYLTSSPILTADWKAPASQQWIVPFGAGGGKIFHIAKLAFNGNLTAYYNVVKPDVGPEWTLRVQLALLLPE